MRRFSWSDVARCDDLTMFARCSCWRCLVKERDYCVEIWNDAGQHSIRIDEIDRFDALAHSAWELISWVVFLPAREESQLHRIGLPPFAALS